MGAKPADPRPKDRVSLSKQLYFLQVGEMPMTRIKQLLTQNLESSGV